ncbi:hypothetical protein FQ775_11905 [Nitratireductor mangrovi]|uniref:Uncharacterized protein n=1 Tax=Nitratireductor mangrovi TaxID=2599600 RepID=A0A5B8KZL3_9HYPH|nr:hypothetical protein [Nitratireductor mangrovi]QDZ01031.1 hypothetical protein FQ775_11905 [Nitratireductor mangrovi]
MIDFLATGKLGPLSVVQNRAEVESLLGTPDDTDLCPFYRRYGNLEILFAEAEPHSIRWFQIEGFAYMRRATTALCSRLRLQLDGVRRSTTVSKLIRLSLRQPAETELHFYADGDEFVLHLFLGDAVEVVGTCQADSGSEWQPGRSPSPFPEDRFDIDSIYGHSTPSGREQRKALSRIVTHRVSGTDYLQQAAATK